MHLERAQFAQDEMTAKMEAQRALVGEPRLATKPTFNIVRTRLADLVNRAQLAADEGERLVAKLAGGGARAQEDAPQVEPCSLAEQMDQSIDDAHDQLSRIQHVFARLRDAVGED